MINCFHLFLSISTCAATTRKRTAPPSPWPTFPRKVGRCRLTVSKPVLKAPWYHLLKLEYDEPLSNFALKFNLRRFSKGACTSSTARRRMTRARASPARTCRGRAVQVYPIKPKFKPPGTKRLKVKYDEVLSILLQFCFQFQLAPLHRGTPSARAACRGSSARSRPPRIY